LKIAVNFETNGEGSKKIKPSARGLTHQEFLVYLKIEGRNQGIQEEFSVK